MFYAIPLENKPSWHNPPWMTVLLILLNMAVFWGPQRSEDKAQVRAGHFYSASTLPALELPIFVRWLKNVDSPYANEAQRLLARRQVAPLLELMQQEPKFLKLLQSDQMITPEHPQYEQWKQERRDYEKLQPAPFTLTWSLNYDKEAVLRPVTWLSSAFLHGSTEHLLGNMLFLFLFGFSVELALGRSAYLSFYLLGAIGASLLAGWAYGGKVGYGLGASGAISALMGMYAVMYRLKRIRFFYQLFFYFNYVTAPALILLPAWMVNELIQHYIGARGIGYMAHLGGLITGAVLMAGALFFRKKSISDLSPTAAPTDKYDEHVENAKRLAGSMQFEAASAQWREAARLRPRDSDTLRAWFNLARLWPAGDDFHRAAHLIFQLTRGDASTLELQHASYQTYLELAKPGVRLKADDMARLARRFILARHFGDAEKLCQALLKTAPDHPTLGDTLSLCANGLLQAGQRERALSWLPHLQRLAPQDMVTRALLKA